MSRRRALRPLGFVGVLVAAVIAAVLLWSWDWFIPFVEARASAAIGRTVSIAHMHVQLGRVTKVTLDDARIANPPGFPADLPPLAVVQHLAVSADVMAYLQHRSIVIPSIDIDHPDISAVALAQGQANYALKMSTGSGPSPEVGAVTIEDGRIHFVNPKLKSDFMLEIATREGSQRIPVGATPAAARKQAEAAQNASEAQPAQLVVAAKGTYAGQPVTGQLVGGAILSLRDTKQPYPVALRLVNGPTHVALVGTIDDPMALKGLDLKLDLAGPDMSLLYPLTAIPIPKTPAYRITGQLDYADRRIRFDDFAGVVGNSDLEGNIAEDPGRERPDVTMDLHSHRVDLADLGGFVGSEPGRVNERNATPAQRRAVAQAEASPKLLPTAPINMPKVTAADIHLNYRGAHIEGRNVPFDRIAVAMDIVDGRITLHPLTLGIGEGEMTGDIALTPEARNAFHTVAEVNFRRVDLSRILGSAGVQGAGLVNGRAQMNAIGNSVATMVGNGNGGASLYLIGGNLSALLVDLSGLEFGNALLSALGMPRRTVLQCFVADFGLHGGILQTRTLMADTNEAIIGATGNIDLKNERINLRINTEAKHFSIGSLPAPIDISGTLKKPGIMPELGPLGLRGGLAAGLGLIAAPLALLPTIQFGTGETHECRGLVVESRREAVTGHPGSAAKPSHRGKGRTAEAYAMHHAENGEK